MKPEQAIYRGCLQRFRPIMMTTMAALLGAVPIALGQGIGGEARRPLGIAVVGGLLLSQTVTLYVTPVIYLYLHRLRRIRAQKQMTAKPFHRLKLLGSVEILSIARLAAETNSSRRFKQSNLYDTQVGSMSDLAI